MSWMVVAVNDDGRAEPVLRNLHGDEASRLAGKMRDQMTEKQVAEGWNYLPRREQFRTKAERERYKLWRTLQSPMKQQADIADRPPAITGGVQANQSQAAGSVPRTLRHSGGTTRGGSPASQAAWTMPRFPK